MTFKRALLRLIHKFPYVSELYKENAHFKKNSCFPAGHFYSPIVSVDEIRVRESSIWGSEKTGETVGINLEIENQLALLVKFESYYEQMPFRSEKSDALRYYFENRFYSYTDGIILYSMIRHFEPKRIVEIGSGFSSALMLDTNAVFFDKEINLVCVEPYPERLYSLLEEGDTDDVEIVQEQVQDVPLEQFEKLEAGDILFVDSSHVVKTGSDVRHILFSILPVLQSGVIIQFHDIFYPFEYPKEWVYKGRNWNEAYFLKSFLMYNKDFEILLFNDFLHRFYKSAFGLMPLCCRNSGGSLWLRKR